MPKKCTQRENIQIFKKIKSLRTSAIRCESGEGFSPQAKIWNNKSRYFCSEFLINKTKNEEQMPKIIKQFSQIFAANLDELAPQAKIWNKKSRDFLFQIFNK